MRALPSPKQPDRALVASARDDELFTDALTINFFRNIAALRPFRDQEFGTHAASPSKAHLDAVTAVLKQRQEKLKLPVTLWYQLRDIARHPEQIAALLKQKELLTFSLKQIEQIWEFYLNLFTQRQGRFANMLLAADRIALDCYQVVYTGLGTARSIPSPAPFAYIESANTPATVRRHVSFSRIQRHKNPFPLVGLPYHRLINPWTIGAVAHEIAHNLQSDLGLWDVIPRRIHEQLTDARLHPLVVQTWVRWHKETWADLCGVLLGGPAIVTSLLEVISASRESTMTFNDMGVHPTPYLRALINFALLIRLGFQKQASRLSDLWARLYPIVLDEVMPPEMLRSFARVSQIVIDVICFQRYQELGNRSLVEVIPFKPTYLAMIDEAGTRLAAGTDPGIVPERFLIGAARVALERKFATPETIARNFYQALANR